VAKASRNTLAWQAMNRGFGALVRFGALRRCDALRRFHALIRFVGFKRLDALGRFEMLRLIDVENWKISGKKVG